MRDLAVVDGLDVEAVGGDFVIIRAQHCSHRGESACFEIERCDGAYSARADEEDVCHCNISMTV